MGHSRITYSNVNLGAARNTLGINDKKWKEIVDKYADILAKHGMLYSLKRMMKRTTYFPVKGSAGKHVILAIKESEAYRVNGKSGYYDMIKLCDCPLKDSISDLSSLQPNLKKAKAMWKLRNSANFTYKKGEYNNSKLLA